jgi:excisionase family DNA binding protein
MHVPTGAEKLAYSLTEACAATSLGRTTLYSHISTGRLKAIKVGGRILIPAEELKALLSWFADQASENEEASNGGAKK